MGQPAWSLQSITRPREQFAIYFAQIKIPPVNRGYVAIKISIGPIHAAVYSRAIPGGVRKLQQCHLADPRLRMLAEQGSRSADAEGKNSNQCPAKPGRHAAPRTRHPTVRNLIRNLGFQSHDLPAANLNAACGGRPGLEFRFGRAYRGKIKKKLAHPTRFERVTFAVGGQRLSD